MNDDTFLKTLPHDLELASARLMVIAGNWSNQEERNCLLAVAALLTKVSRKAYYQLSKVVEIYDYE